jgi:putative ABC transport system ATP-binding protein
VCIARALAHRPRYLLADEPTGQLDHTTSLTVLHALSDLLDATAATLVVATHDPDVAAACNTVFDLVDGKAIPR